MAKALLNAAIDAAYGHLGSLSFSQALSGTIVTAKPNLPLNRTATQKQAAQAWTAMVRAWIHDTTPSQKTAWKNLGATSTAPKRCGSTHPLSGFQEFARVNTRLGFRHATLKLDPPSSDTTTGPGALTATYTPGTPPSITIEPTANPSATQTVIIQCMPPTNAGNIAKTKRYKTVALLAAGTPGPWELESYLLAFFGQILTNRNYKFSVEYSDFTSGAQSSPSKIQLLT